MMGEFRSCLGERIGDPEIYFYPMRIPQREHDPTPNLTHILTPTHTDTPYRGTDALYSKFRLDS
jgi:hypothetical protein